mgnify:CR=1 FL=1
MDRISPQKRSEVMSRIKGKNTKPELVVRRLLHRMGYRFRLHRKDLPGKPDIVLPKWRTAIFVHGCFWHGHECPRGSTPASNVEFWSEKIRRNKERDQRAVSALGNAGWQVLTLWECELKVLDDLTKRLEAIGEDESRR